jgi:class 3 adenylate cyclase
VHELGPGSVFDVPPGHDGWNAGAEVVVTIEWGGLRDWLLPQQAGRMLAALLFTDIVDSTVHARELGDRAWRSRLAAHHEIVRAIVADTNGREVDTTGDGFLVVFDAPLRAIAAARRIRDAMAGLGLVVRQGIHVGEVEAVGTDVRGVAVHRAARVMAVAGPGEILVSSTTRALVEDRGVQFESRGRHELKGIPGADELFAV